VLEDVQVDLDVPCTAYNSVDPSLCVAPIVIAENYLDHTTNYFITNLDGHYPGTLAPIPAMVRNYNAFQLTAEKRLSNNWQLLGSYQYATLKGNYEGLFRRDNGQSDPNITSIGDFGPSPFLAYTFSEGVLPNDTRHIFKVFGNYQFSNGLNTGMGFNVTSGIPITMLGSVPVYGEQERVLEPRGAHGRTDTIWTLDLHADYGFTLGGSNKITVGGDVFNLFNKTTVTEVWNSSQFDNLTLNPDPDSDFLKPFTFQDPIQVRVFVRYSF
jgi:hypothetical protein